MVQTINDQDISLEELQEYFGLQLTTDSQFFPEWQDNLPSLIDEEKHRLERVRSNYFNRGRIDVLVLRQRLWILVIYPKAPNLTLWQHYLKL